MLDPLILRLLALSFALLFLIAALHKLSNRPEFLANLLAYEVLPRKFAPVIALLIPPLEFLLGLGWLALGLTGIALEFVPLASIVILSVYTFGIGLNILRGRTYIDCGCGFSSSNFSNSGNNSQQISAALLFRNVSLIAAALATTLPIIDRSLQAIDILGLVFALATTVLTYAAFNQLLINRNAINSWRHQDA